jgi:ribosomal protein S18 acetylase RimI-like enzyme
MSSVLQSKTQLSVKPQAFEAEVFGAPVWRLEMEGSDLPTSGEVDDLVVQARDEKVALIACRFEVDSPIAGLLSQAGFYKVERLVTYHRPIPIEAGMSAGISVAEASDARAAIEIGRKVFSFDRYHADPKIPKSVADEIKARWVGNGISGRSDVALITQTDGVVTGFNLCMRRGGDAVIDLIGVADGYQGMGIGKNLVEGALAHYAGRASVMWVGTPETNLASIALYRQTGFLLHDVAETWHWTE